MWIFVRMPHAVDVTNVSRCVVPTGIAVAKAVTGVQLGNKGAVGIGFRWRETTLAFCMTHLPARADVSRLRKRESDYRRITHDLRLETPSVGAPAGGAAVASGGGSATAALPAGGLDFIHSHDHVWFFGDTNYRVDLPFDR